MRRRDVEDDDTVRDGETLRTPMYLMDSVQRPLLSADAARELRRSARAEYVRALQDDWKNVPSGKHSNSDAAEPDASEALLRRHLRTEPDDDAQARRDAAWAQYKDRLSNAWRGRTDPSRASEIEREGERWRGSR